MPEMDVVLHSTSVEVHTAEVRCLEQTVDYA